MKSLKNSLSDLYMRDIWGVKVGIGTHVVLKFGEGWTAPKTGKIRGEYEIWIPGAPWRLEQGGTILVGSGHDTLDLDALSMLEGGQIDHIDFDLPFRDIVIGFKIGLRLRIFNEHQSGSHIVFFFPDNVYSVEGDGSIVVEGRPSAKT